MASYDLYDRELLLYGSKRDEVLALGEVQQYGIDSFGDPDYVRIYGLRPEEWYARGIRLLGRTAVECTRDDLARLIGRDVAQLAGAPSMNGPLTVIDPFAGSCNTIFWILKHLPGAAGLAFELDDRVFELTRSNLTSLNSPIELVHGDYRQLLQDRLPLTGTFAYFVAPPWGHALDERNGLDLARTQPPIGDVVDLASGLRPQSRTVFAVQIFERVEETSLRAVRDKFASSELRIYGMNEAGKNHGILLGTRS